MINIDIYVAMKQYVNETSFNVSINQKLEKNEENIEYLLSNRQNMFLLHSKRRDAVNNGHFELFHCSEPFELQIALKVSSTFILFTNIPNRIHELFLVQLICMKNDVGY